MTHIYEFLYCDCIHESTYATISIHLTPKGAYNAMKNYITEEFNEWRDRPNFYRKSFKAFVHQGYCIRKREILP